MRYYWKRYAGGRAHLLMDGEKSTGAVVGYSESGNNKTFIAKVRGKILMYSTVTGAKMRVERENGIQTEWFKTNLARIQRKMGLSKE